MKRLGGRTASLLVALVFAGGCYTKYSVVANVPEGAPRGSALLHDVDSAIRPLGFEKAFRIGDTHSYVYTGRTEPRGDESVKWTSPPNPFDDVLDTPEGIPSVGYETGPLPPPNSYPGRITVALDTDSGRLVIRDSSHTEETEFVQRLEAALQARVAPDAGLKFERISDFPDF